MTTIGFFLMWSDAAILRSLIKSYDYPPQQKPIVVMVLNTFDKSLPQVIENVSSTFMSTTGFNIGKLNHSTTSSSTGVSSKTFFFNRCFFLIRTTISCRALLCLRHQILHVQNNNSIEFILSLKSGMPLLKQFQHHK